MIIKNLNLNQIFSIIAGFDKVGFLLNLCYKNKK